MTALVLVAACQTVPGPPSAADSAVHSACPSSYGCDAHPEALGVDVVSRRHVRLPGPGEAAGMRLAVRVVGGAPMLLATLHSGVAVEAFPTDAQWDLVRHGYHDIGLGVAAGLGDWPDPIVAADNYGVLYTGALVDGQLGVPPLSDGSRSALAWPDVTGQERSIEPNTLQIADLDGDDTDDVLMSWPVLALRGPPGAGPDVWPEPMFELYSDEGFGYTLGEVADLTGDDVPDLTFSRDHAGQGVWVVPGGPLPRYADVRGVGWLLVNEGGEASRAMATGDVTGDGVNDLVIGTPFANADGGEVFVVAGPITGDGSLADAVARIRPMGPHERCGISVEVLQDQNGDGHDEVVVSCPDWREQGVDGPGRVELYSGAEVVGELDADDAALVLHTVNDDRARAVDHFGFTVEADLDLTGDGLQDLVISAPSEVRDGLPGGVYVLESPVIE